MRPEDLSSDQRPMWSILRGAKRALFGIGALSAAINVLVLGGSIYMMLVYDRVLPSHSIVTLVGLLILVLAVYAIQAGFEILRANMLGDIAADFSASLRPRLSRLTHQMAIEKPAVAANNSPLRDLDQVQSFIAGPGPAALIDLPWIVFFLFVLSVLHVWLGVTAFVGALVLVALTWATDKVNRHAVKRLTTLGIRRNRLGETYRMHAEVIAALGMRDRMIKHASSSAAAFTSSQRDLNELNTRFAVITRTSRMVLQSLILTVGALLVLKGEATGGVIFASAILSGRALAPVDQALAQWRSFVAARASWARLDLLLAHSPEDPVRVALPAPANSLRVEKLEVSPPGIERLTVDGVSFELKAGSVLGIIGVSAAGKSSLVRAIVGAWPIKSGEVRIDGAAKEQWDADDLGQHIGYLPQAVEMFDGTVAYNIARCDESASSESVIEAAKAAGVHELILALPDGYQFDVGEGGMNLSAGQRQRIGLARAMFGQPFLIVLDEPNSNLDVAGEKALVDCLRKQRERGAIVLIVAHRHNVLECATHLLVLDSGKVRDFGPRNDVLARLSSQASEQTRKTTVNV